MADTKNQPDITPELKPTEIEEVEYCPICNAVLIEDDYCGFCGWCADEE